MFGKEIKFRPATFYLGVADFLAGEVEGQPKIDEDGEGEDGIWSVSSSPKSSGQFENERISESAEEYPATPLKPRLREHTTPRPSRIP
jgi:triacylglycerol lipase